MKVNNISTHRNNNASFKAARLNIVAMSDTHGQFVRTPWVESAITTNQKDIFEKTDYKDPSKKMDPRSVANMIIHAGDFGINEGGGNYISDKTKKNGDYQLYFIDMIAKIAEKAAKKEVGEDSQFYALRTYGNHDFDNGDEYILDKSKDSVYTTLVTNANMGKSPILRDYMKKYPEKFVQSKIISIPDDKHLDDRNFDRKVLVLGVTIPTMDFYAPGLLKGTEFHDNSNKKDAKLKKEDLKETIVAVKKRVDAFKKEYPKGAVILLSHTGNQISNWICEDVKHINIVMNGHDHKRQVSHVNKTAIHSLGKDNELVKAFQLYFDDNGDLKRVQETNYDTAIYNSENHKHNTITQQLIEKLLPKDAIPAPDVIDYQPLKDKFNNEIYTEIPYDETNIRGYNDYVANIVSSYDASAARAKIDSDIASVAIQSSAIRGGFHKGMTNIDLMEIFNGVSEDLAGLSKGEITGRELVGVIVENVFDNLDSPKRNTLLQWSDTKIDKDMIARLREKDGLGKYEVDLDKYAKAVKMRNIDTQEYEPIDMNKKYTVLLPHKFLIKTDLKYPVLLSKDNRFEPTGYTTEGLFRAKLASKEYTVKLSPKTQEERVICKVVDKKPSFDEEFVSVPFFKA